ncbi:MAG: hypothetical protein JNM93_12695 [Bacteriovoracaceae bacterium]|nr:hypothetical protein [Bacteriovoracaceae bacterium]
MFLSSILSFFISLSFGGHPSRCAVTYDYNGSFDEATCSDGTKVDKFVPKRASKEVHSALTKAMKNLGYNFKRSHFRQGDGATDFHFVKNEKSNKEN